MSLKMMTEDIVISGMGGRFPESESTDEFAKNLYNNVDMIVEDDRRWPTDLYGMNSRMGKLKNIEKFDGQFFGIMPTMGDAVDPHSRILLETTYEAIMDAGISPQTLRGSNTGVYIGYSTFGMPDGIPEEVQPDSQNSMTETLLWIPGNSKCLYANRISFVFDFKGPSLVVDTACSSSLVAFNTAMNDLRLGKCDQAIVGGTQVNLQPFTNHIFQTTRLNSFDGIPKVWDETADGFVRGEAVCTLFLQRKGSAKRIYATVLNSGVNIDGNKRMGMFFPSSEGQEELMVKVYKEANIDPLKVNYFEAHATGTKAGDPQEAKAIFNAYCALPKRSGTLPIGLLKSNIGHTEGASGVSSLAKVLLAYENECIPASLHLKNIKSAIADMCPPLVPITENFKYTPGIAGVNNFGVGGVNAHVLIEPNYKTESENNDKIADNIPRIINICGRTEEALNAMFDFIQNNPDKVTRDFLALLTDTMKYNASINSAGLPYRGSMLIKQKNTSDIQLSYEYKRQFSVLTDKTQKPVWFLFPGLGGQWSAMARALMPIKIFADKIDECHEILKPFGIDLKYLLLAEDKKTMSTMTNKFCSTTALEIGLFEVMKGLGITPDGIIGHSFGEIAAAYADGCLTTKEALLITYIRGVVTENDKKIPKGLMAVVGMPWSEAKKLCPKGVSVVCNNARDSVVFSGLYKETKELVETLKGKGLFVRELQSSDIPYHSEYLVTSAKKMTDEIKKFLPNPKLRSKKWLSTAIMASDIPEELKYASAEYFVHNLISPVYFYNKLQHLPSNAIVIELGPHALFAKTITQTLEASTHVSFVKKDSNPTNLDLFLTSIAKLYEIGLNPNIENLYPKVEFPVARNTQSISSLMKWDHQKSYFVRKFPDFHFKGTASDLIETINIQRQNHLSDHCIDGNVLFPATGYLMLAWRHLAALRGRVWNQIPVVFEDIQFRRPVFVSDTNDMTKLKVKIFEQTGDFMIFENQNLCCLGKIKSPDEEFLCVQELIEDLNGEKVSEEEIILNNTDIYKDLRAVGYDYGNTFRGLKSIGTSDFQTMKGKVLWDGNWVTFMDSLLQTMGVAMPFRRLMVPVMIKRLRCDPKALYEGVAKNKVIVSNEEFDEEQAINNVVDSKEQSDKDFEDMIEIDKNMYFEGVIGAQFHFYESILPFHVELNSRMIVTNGIEIEDLMALPIPRKTNVQDLKLESYQFLANEDNNAIEVSDHKYLMDYIKVCSNIASKTKNILQCEDAIANNAKDTANEAIEARLKDIKDNEVMLKILNKVYHTVKDENRNFDNNTINAMIGDLQAKPEFDISSDVINQVSKNERLIRSLLDIVSENYVPKREIKVLEINLTNGLMAAEVDNLLGTSHIYPVDVSYAVAVNSIDSVPEDLKNKSFKFSEWDHKCSSFPLEVSTTTDLIVLRDSNELRSLELDVFLQEAYDVIVNKGFLLSVFKCSYTEAELSLNSMNGRKNLQNSDLEQRIVEFVVNAKKIGFSVIGRKFDSINSVAILFRKVDASPALPKNENILKVSANCFKWFDLVKQKLIEMKDNEEMEPIWLIANDSELSGIVGLVNCLRLEPGGDVIRCLFDCDNLTGGRLNFNEKPFSEILANDLTINVLKNGVQGTYRHLTLPKDFDKTMSKNYFLNVGQTRDLSNLQWFDSKNLVPSEHFYDLCNKPKRKVKCNVYSSGLNFRDVMLATGRILSGPESLFTDCVLGLEFAGRRCDTGERVCGFDISRCFASSIQANEDLITNIPKNWSMDDAVTIMCTYSTVWYGLIERAQLQKNESILIHSGAGGVGQAAINVCKNYDCDIFVTVGTEEKKQFLMKEFNIPENRIFSSRDTQFKYRIKSLTNGRGVDLVLNSLAGDKLEASYECVADCGRFVEIGKYDLQMNKQLGMFSFLRDISFIGVSVDRKLYLTQGFTQRFFDWMHKNSDNGMIKPTNKTVFNAEEADKAFKYMTTGKHIGKIIIRMREEEKDNKLIQIKQAQEMLVTTKTYFNPSKVYIITGGLGGFGLELVHWMLFLGARKFILTSRNGIKNEYQKFVMNRIESLSQKFRMFETKIIVSTQNTSTVEGSHRLIEEAKQLGPIGGIFHLALVLNDCLLENQTIDKFCETIDSKSKVFENLDKISRDLKLDLDYFVVFSSVSCGKGNAGQTNYGYANSVCEHICEGRRKDGMHGLAIQWGPIGDVGVIADTEMSSLSGIVKQRINSCLETLDKLLQSQQAVVSCVVRAKRVTQDGSRESKIIGQVWSALGVDPKTTPEHLTLGEIGMESMFAVELQQGLERDYSIKVTMNDIKNVTVKHIKEFEAGKVEELRKFADEVKMSREKLAKVKFLIPGDAFARLNDVKTGNPIYFLPPLEGIFASLEALAEKIDRPVIGLNWTKDMEKLKSVKEISNYYTNLLNTVHPDGNYDIVGHFYGALIVSKMLKKKAPIVRAAIIDMMSGTEMDEEMNSDEKLIDMIMKFICKDLPKPMVEKLNRELKLKTDVNGKLSKLSSEIKEFVGKGFVARDLDNILKNSFNRAKLFSNYRLKFKNKLRQAKWNAGKKYLEMSGKLLIIKPLADKSQTNDKSDRIMSSYFLPEKGLEGKLNFETVDADPNDYSNKVFNQIAVSLNKFMI